uniref:Uncharacterized protein n=1 Tax=Arundo donax TaxID=35708 RepID=A0A0A9FKK8_ARUDO
MRFLDIGAVHFCIDPKHSPANLDCICIDATCYKFDIAPSLQANVSTRLKNSYYVESAICLQ